MRRSFKVQKRGESIALDLPDLDIAAGQCLAVTGPNGAGKTTLLRLVAGLLRPDEGDVVVAGQNLAILAEHELDRFRARNIGYLSQGNQLLEGLTAEQNVMVAMLFAGYPPKVQRERARALLERFGVEHRARHLPHALSGGERQRIALARALANDPPLVLADEPTSSLDESSARRLMAELHHICRKEQRAVILVTHHREHLWACDQQLHIEPPEPSREGAE